MRLGALVAASCALLLSACFRVEMHDVSADPAYSRVIGKEIRLKEDVWALGTAWNYKLPADEVLLEGGVGFAGPEVVSRDMMCEGSIVRVTKVLAARPLGLLRVRYVVEEVNTNDFPGEKLEIRLFEGGFGATPRLPDQYFELIDAPPSLRHGAETSSPPDETGPVPP